MDSSPRRASLLALLLLALFVVSAAAQTPPIRIMPMGDSITDGSSNDSPDGVGGYRGALYTLLTNAGYNVESVGTLTINSQLLPANQKAHEGHSGWRIDQLYDNVIGWFGAIPDPDVILLHIGTNDFGQNFDIVNAINRLDALITRMTQERPYAHIIVTNLMVRDAAHYNDIQTYFNPFVQDKVNTHANNGERVTFLDMNAVVPLSDMPDQLHPNQTGYNKMAAAWLPAIQAVIGPQGDSAPPVLVRALGLADRTHVTVTFSKPVDDTTAANPANYALDGGLTVSAAQLDATKRIVTLTTSTVSFGTTYTVTVNGVKDRIATPNTIAANSAVSFTATAQRGYLNNVPEGPAYTLVYSLDLPATANYKAAQPAYAIDNHLTIGSFDRVAYYLELQTSTGALQYAWVSMDAFTQNAGQIGVPTLASGAQFQQLVTGMNVVSNVDGVANGTNIGGNLEFWPINYRQANTANIPGADGSLYDFGDQPFADGFYGSMQIHNTDAGKTVIAFNNWGGTANNGNFDLGIGNNPNSAPNGPNGRDWTFEHNAANYTVKSLQVFVRTTNDLTPPALSSAKATFGATQVIVRFSEPLAPTSVSASDFTLDHGVAVLGARLAANQRDVYLTTTQQPAATSLTLTVSGIRDSSSAANLIPPGTSITVAAAALPSEIVNNVGNAANGYQLVYSIDLPVVGNLNSANRYNIDDHLAAGPFSRVAYYLELQTGTQTQFVWVAMDPFTTGAGNLGLPLASTGAVFQQNVTNMDVISNVAGIVTGTGLTGGNIEFWPTNYSAPNGAAVPNADLNGDRYNFGDTRTLTGTYGSMQIHNHSAALAGGGIGQTLFAINNWGADGNILDIGIGNDPAPVNLGDDWTFSNNAGSYLRRTLHVMVLPGTSTDPAVVARVPEAANYQLVYSQNIPTTGNLTSGTGFVGYAADYHTAIGPFSRIAYYMELQGTGDAQSRYVWVSMDAFTANAGRIGIPTNASGAFFQQNVANMNVFSNVASIVTGTGITTGNIEFWPSNYTGANSANVPNASATNFDWGDGGAGTGQGYGSMQVHNYAAALAGGGTGQTLFALNHWGSANQNIAMCAGIGNAAGANTDWTFADNTNKPELSVKRVLQVYVLPVNNLDFTGPTITNTKGSTSLNRLVVTFNEAVTESSANPANFSIPGLTVSGATLLASQRDIALTTSAQTAGTVYTVNVTGVRDRSPAANLVAPNTSGTFTAFTASSLLASIPDTAGYQLIYQLAIPNNKPQWDLNPVTYSVDESKYGEMGFDRVAYCLELKLATAPTGDPANYVYASFDTFTNTITKIGVPTLSVSATAIQQTVAHMNVASNVPAIVTGTDISTGYIEFWGGNYAVGNTTTNPVPPNADATVFDWGDQMNGGGHGCMQIHNYGAAALDNNGQPVNGQTLFGYSDWGTNAPGANADANSDLGIGTYFNNPNNAQGKDWTFAKNTGTYSVKNLYVLARPAVGGIAPTFLSYPASRTVNANGTASFAVTALNAASYQWRFNGTPIPGQTNPWLTLTGVTAANAGSYDVVATGGGGIAVTSLAATLSIGTGNTPPTAGNYSLTTKKNTAANIARAALVAKATDPDAGNTLTVSAVSPTSTQGGTVTLNATNVVYTPAANFLGTDTFTFTISDGAGGSANGTATVSVTSLTPVGAGQVAYGFRGDGKFDVVFAGTAGQNYQLQRATDLTAPSPWTTIQTLRAGDDGLLPCFDPAPPADHAFYRIILGP